MNSKMTDKFAEIVNYICHKYNQGDMTEMKLWKLLFFCEADYYEKYNQRLTDFGYIKNTYGPTPEYPLTKSVIKKLFDKKCVIYKSDRLGRPVFDCPCEPKLNILSAKELESIQETCEKYFRLSANKLSLLSHNDPVFLAAEKDKDALDFSLVRYRPCDDEDDSSNREVKRDIVSLSDVATSKLASLFS